MPKTAKLLHNSQNTEGVTKNAGSRLKQKANNQLLGYICVEACKATLAIMYIPINRSKNVRFAAPYNPSLALVERVKKWADN